MNGKIVIKLRKEKRFLGLTFVRFQKQGFLFGVHAWVDYWQYLGEHKGFKYPTELLYFLAADNYQKHFRLDTNFTIEDIKKWIADNPQSEINKIAQCLADSQMLGESVGSWIVESAKDEKKK